MEANGQLLYRPVDQLGLSKTFVEKCHLMGFMTIGDALSLKPRDLSKRKEFSYTWLGELTDLLSMHQLLHLLQPLPGNNPA
jgi:hypothetical protein